METLIHYIERQTAARPGKTVFHFLEEGADAQQLTYDELWEAMARTAAELAAAGLRRGDRVILLFPSGLQFPAAFLGAIYAGVVPVPAYPPRLHKEGIAALRRVATDCSATAILAARGLAGKISAFASELPCPIVVAGSSATSGTIPPGAMPEIAYLQYTSGSTATPKGVVITHTNLLDNLDFVRRSFGITPSSVGVHWLPPYHDMGLVGAILSTVAGGASSVLMPPIYFIQNPARWLQAISTYGGTISGGPNFAFDLCVNKIDAARRSALDLGSWDVAFNGAERVRAATLRRFAEAFGPHGFRPSAFLPSYGLAEATLMVSGDRLKQIPSDDTVVACGAIERANGVVRIIDRKTLRPLSEGAEGEIVVSNGSVAAGYWRRDAETSATFGLIIDGKCFLRTGDVGFIRDEELVISGRAKEMVIIRGRNHYPEDIERVVAASHAALALNASAAFAGGPSGEELVVVQEVRRDQMRTLDADAVIGAMREAIVAAIEVRPGAVVLVRPATLPKTQNGKIQRLATRDAFVDGTLSVVASWEAPDQSAEAAEPPPGIAAGDDGVTAMRAWLIRRLAREAGVDADEIALADRLERLALDSLQQATLIGELAETFGSALSPTLLADYSTIDALATYLAVVVDIRARLQLLPEEQRRPMLVALADAPASETVTVAVPEDHFRIGAFPEVRALADRQRMLLAAGVPNPFFTVISRVDGARVLVDGRRVTNYSSNNYLGLADHPRVRAAAHEAIDGYGTSVSASRIVAGERPIHGRLEAALATLIGAEDALAFVGGNTANVSTIAHLVGPRDLVVYDERSHDSVLRGIALAHATGYAFRHNRFEDAERILAAKRRLYRRALVFIEGIYSMEGDIPDLPRFIEIKNRHQAMLMVDECLSIGVLGAHGRGIGEHFSIDPADVDIWMGGLSKALASCGGYIAGSRTLIDYLRYTTPGFIFTTGMSPANAAAALAAVEVLQSETWRVRQLHENARFFLSRAQELGLDTGTSAGTPAIPVMVGDPAACMALYARLREQGVNVQPIFVPAVPANASRLRFFVTCMHTGEEMESTLALLAAACRSTTFA